MNRTVVGVSLAATAFVGFVLWRDRKHAADDAVLRAELQTLKTALAEALAGARKTDTLFRSDTVTLTKTRVAYKVLRDSLRITDTVLVAAALDAADSTIAACTRALQTCEVRVAQRDSIISLLQAQAKTTAKLAKVPARRFLPFAEGTYDPINRAAVPRAGVEIRLWWGVTAIAAAEYELTATRGERSPARLLVGARKTF